MLVRALVLVIALALPMALFAGPSAEGSTTDAVDLIWIMGNPGQVPLDQAMVEEVLDEISIREVGAKVTTLYYDNDRTQLALASGEDWDIVFTCEWFNNFAVQARAGYYADLTDLLKTEAPGLYRTMPEIVWEGAKVDGKILAIPVKKDYAAELFYRFDKELYVEKLGMNPPQLPDDMTFADIEPYLEKGKEAHESGLVGPEGQYPLNLVGSFPGVDALFDHINRDALLAIPYSAVGTPDSNKIEIIVEHPDMYDRLVKLHEWYEAGYINKDAATRTDPVSYSPIKIGQGFYGADAIWTGADGYVQTISRFSGPFLSTASIRGSMNSISADSENIEIALKYQELVNTNQEYRDILRYGVEGTHWNWSGEGLIKQTDTGRQRYRPWPFSQGSYSLSSVEAAEGVDVDPDMWKVIFDGYQDLKATNTIGFSFDIAPVESQVAAIKVIKDKYWKVLTTGTVDPSTEVPKMIEELEAAGIRRVQQEAQRQFDAFLAGK
jgi:putative aldouronate transport system substrate-binding protein